VTTVDLGGPAIAEPPPQIQELIGVIRQVTVLIKEQARDLGRSRRLRRLISSLDGPGIGASEATEGRPALLYWLSRIDEIIDPLETTFINQLVAAYSVDPARFEALGLTANTSAWRLKHAAFSVAAAYAQQEPPSYMSAEAKVLREIEQRGPAFEIGDSIIGSALAAVPAVGSFLSEGYQEVKENLEALGGIAKNAASAAVVVARRAFGLIAKPFKRNTPPPREPATAEE
jgi:hypothetical protein